MYVYFCPCRPMENAFWGYRTLKWQMACMYVCMYVCMYAGRLILTLFGTTLRMQPKLASGGSFWAFLTPSPECSQNDLWEAPFGSFWPLAQNVAKMGQGKLILSLLGPRPRMLTKLTPRGSEVEMNCMATGESLVCMYVCVYVCMYVYKYYIIVFVCNYTGLYKKREVGCGALG